MWADPAGDRQKSNCTQTKMYANGYRQRQSSLSCNDSQPSVFQGLSKANVTPSVHSVTFEFNVIVLYLPFRRQNKRADDDDEKLWAPHTACRLIELFSSLFSDRFDVTTKKQTARRLVVGPSLQAIVLHYDFLIFEMECAARGMSGDRRWPETGGEREPRYNQTKDARWWWRW